MADIANMSQYMEDTLHLHWSSSNHVGIIFGLVMEELFRAGVILCPPFILTGIEQEWAPSRVGSGLVGTSLFIGWSLGALLFSKLSHKFGRKRMAILSLIIMFSGHAMSILVSQYWLFLCCRALAGVALGQVSHVWLTELTNSNGRGIVIGVASLGWVTGGMLLPTLASLLHNFSWRCVLAIALLPGILSLTIYASVVPESPRWLVMVGRNSEALEVCKFLSSSNPPTANRPQTDDNDSNGKPVTATPVPPGRSSTPPAPGTPLTPLTTNVTFANAQKNSSTRSVNTSEHQHAITIPDAVETKPPFPTTQHTNTTTTSTGGLCSKGVSSRFSVLLLLFMCAPTVYYSLALNLRNMAGSVYTNGFLLMFIELPCSLLFLLAAKKIKRKPFTIGSLWGCTGCLLGILAMPEGMLLWSMIGKLGITTTIQFAYLLGTELFASSNRASAMGIANFVGRLTSSMSPVLVETVGTSNPQLFVLGLATATFCTAGACITLPETKGAALPVAS
eukprot:TRINITY_DN55657_c0_g1_i1.p1 TRINITY_DN55657_c0_g1~~TRINITY_DN55657_c0_g1_i1.p1  ORF type:complete len:505 (-),score=32.93 TRINITY_DN55657_c0_g1_i1:40-1554(-)